MVSYNTISFSTPLLIMTLRGNIYEQIGWYIITSDQGFNDVVDDDECKEDIDRQIRKEYSEFFDNIEELNDYEDSLCIRHYPVTAENGVLFVRKSEFVILCEKGKSIKADGLKRTVPIQIRYMYRDVDENEDIDTLMRLYRRLHEKYRISVFLDKLKEKNLNFDLNDNDVTIYLELIVNKNTTYILPGNVNHTYIYWPNDVLIDTPYEEQQLRFARFLASWQEFIGAKIHIALICYLKEIPENFKLEDHTKIIDKIEDNFIKSIEKKIKELYC